MVTSAGLTWQVVVSLSSGRLGYLGRLPLIRTGGRRRVRSPDLITNRTRKTPTLLYCSCTLVKGSARSGGGEGEMGSER